MRRSLIGALAVVLAAVCAACVPFGGGSGLNPEQRSDLARAKSLESIEVFKRDVEPAIIRARNELMTRDNYRNYRGNDFIYEYPVGDQKLYSMISRAYDFDEHDSVRVRAVFAGELEPLGFVCRERTYTDNDGTTDLLFVWTSERYGVVVKAMVAENWLTSTSYYTGYLRSDGTSSDPQALAEIPGRAPEWLADVAVGKQS